jgi:predicted ATPase/DNA-binding SARP family transcriptional activator
VSAIDAQVSEAGTPRIEFRLLGSVEAVRDGDAVPLGGPRQRALLALLLLAPGRAVPAGRLVEELWNGRPPRGASGTLPTYVSKLRAALGEDVAISSGSNGYAIEALPEQLDVARFEKLAAEGREALVRGASRRAAERLQAALAQWRGRPFGELSDGGALQREADRLEDVRLLALEDRIEAELALGQSAELIDELEELVQSHRYRERLWRELMLALYRAERQADALAAYRRVRRILDEELGLEPSDDLKQLEQAILRQDVPEAERPEERHNLPVSLTSFVGREGELAEIDRLLAETRLLTLTGVGGVGKTRLGLESARRALPDFPDGVWFSDLSALTDPALVPPHVATVFDVREQGEVAVDALLIAGLRDSEVLLVLDNCEHLRQAVAELAQSLLTACPRLHVLATSREALGMPGEVDYLVQPLPLPAADADLDALRASEAVRLFLARVHETRPRLRADAAAVSNAARICRDLDGLPLALELAAARAKALSLDEIANRLADRFRFLVSWRRLSASRHRTLREAMDWSYELLTKEEQALLARLSVFAGGFTLAAAANVCLDGDDERALELVGRLVDASLVVAGEQEDAMPYHLLETVRQYAGEALEDPDEIRRRHAEWCLALAEESEPQLTGVEQARWFARLEAEAANFRGAFAYFGVCGEAGLRLRLAIALSRFRYVRGHLAESRESLERALADADEEPPALRRRALTAAAAVALLQGDHAHSMRFAEQALAVAREDGDPRLVANGLSNLGAIVLAAGDHARAELLLMDAVGRAREAGDTRIAALAINNLGDLALTVGEYERAEPLFEESLELLRQRGDTANVARSLFNLGAVALQLGRPTDARERFRESLELADAAGDKEDLAWCFEGVAALAAAAGRGESAALLLGASKALIAAMGATPKPFERQLHDNANERARELCGADAFAAATERGAQLELFEALALAQAELS